MNNNIRYTLLAFTTLVTVGIVSGLWYFGHGDNTNAVFSTLLTIGAYSGLIGYLGFDDLLIWYKNWATRKYPLCKNYKLRYRYYNDNLSPDVTETKVKLIKRYVSLCNRIIYFKAINEHENIIYLKINPITNGVTIVDSYGNPVKPTSSRAPVTAKEFDYIHYDLRKFFFGESEEKENHSIAIESIDIWDSDTSSTMC